MTLNHERSTIWCRSCSRGGLLCYDSCISPPQWPRHRSFSGNFRHITIFITIRTRAIHHHTLADLFNNRYDILTEDYDSWQKDSHLTIWQSYRQNLTIPLVFSVRATLDWTYDEIRCWARLPVMLPIWCYTDWPASGMHTRMTQSLPALTLTCLDFLSSDSLIWTFTRCNFDLV